MDLGEIKDFYRLDPSQVKNGDQWLAAEPLTKTDG